MTPRSVAEFAALIGGEVVAGSGAGVVRGAAVDTRKLDPGQAFFAIRGARTDGHDHCASALAEGAACAVVTRIIDVAMPQIKVPTVEAALASMARGLIAEWEPTVAAITGSVGKTSVKAMLGRICARRWPTAVALGNLNSDLGMPLAVANADHEAEMLVLEFAMRGTGQIRELTQMAPPHVSLITNIGVSHMEVLGSREAIAAAKREIFEGTQADGTACGPADDEYFDYLMEGFGGQQLSYGVEHEADVRGRDIRATADGVALTVEYGDETADVMLGAPGEHQGFNALAAACAGIALGADLTDVAEGLFGFQPEPHRGRLLNAQGGFQIIDDCYNASPDSMDAAVAVLAAHPCSGRRVAVLGDMRELGRVAETEHRALGRRVGAAGVTALVTVGELGALIAEGAEGSDMAPAVVTHQATRDRALAWLADYVAAGDVLLVKASRSLELEELVASLLQGGGPQ